MRILTKSKKGQYFSLDAIVASIIFIMSFIALTTYWFSMKSVLEWKSEEMNKDALRISDTILSPSFRINQNEFSALQSKDQTKLKEMFSTIYNISMLITPLPNGTQITIGPDVQTLNTVNIIKVKRIFVLYNLTNESIATLELFLYN